VKNLTIEWGLAESHNELLPEFAQDLVRLPVEVILAVGGLAAGPAHQATSTIPIVMVAGPDPTAPPYPGMVQSFARPGANVTGNTYGATIVGTKSVECLKTLLPQLSRLAILGDRSTPNDADLRVPATRAAQTLGVQVLDLDVRSGPDVDGLLEAAQTSGVDALFALPKATLDTRWPRIWELAARSRLAVMYGIPAPVTDHGGHLAFSPNLIVEWRQGVDYVDKILRGVSPADLPVQQPRQFDFVVNVKAAQALGITFPSDAAAQVTQWIQ
jgi:putative ABC transport system substrate-binding protein